MLTSYFPLIRFLTSIQRALCKQLCIQCIVERVRFNAVHLKVDASNNPSHSHTVLSECVIIAAFAVNIHLRVIIVLFITKKHADTSQVVTVTKTLLSYVLVSRKCQSVNLRFFALHILCAL